MPACSGIHGRAYEVYLPPSVDVEEFPWLVRAIQRELGFYVSVTCSHHEGPFDEDDELRKTVIGISMENVPANEAMPDGHERACKAVYRELIHKLRVKFTDPAGSVICSMAPV